MQQYSQFDEPNPDGPNPQPSAPYVSSYDTRAFLKIPKGLEFDTKASWHWKCMFLTLGVLVCLCLLILFTLKPESGSITAPAICLCVLYLAYLIECFCCSNMYSYLSNAKHGASTANGHLQAVRQDAPTVTMAVECYHYETRTKIEHYTDSEGHQKTRTVTETVRVPTFSASAPLRFDAWEDDSTNWMNNLDDFKFVRIKASKELTYADPGTEQICNAQREGFQAQHRHRDVHMDFTENIHLPNYQAHSSCVAESLRESCLINPGAYVACSIFLLSWPFRMLLERVTARVAIQIRKRIRIVQP